MGYKISTLLALNTESNRQLEKWGTQDHAPQFWMSILGEEFGEACKDANDNTLQNYQAELIQVAAVALTALENVQEQLCQRQTTNVTQ